MADHGKGWILTMTSTAEPNYWSLLGLDPDSDADA